MSAISMMRNTCQITTATEGTSSTGELTTTFATSVTPTICSIQQVTGREAIYQGRLQGVRQFEIFFPVGTSVSAQSTLTGFTGPSGLDSSLVLEVLTDPIDHAGRNAYIMVGAEEKNL